MSNSHIVPVNGDCAVDFIFLFVSFYFLCDRLLIKTRACASTFRRALVGEVLDVRPIVTCLLFFTPAAVHISTKIKIDFCLIKFVA